MSTFISEFLVLVGTFTRHKGLAVLATTGIILAAIYVLYLYQRTFQGKISERVAQFRDLNVRETLAVAPLIALIVFLGIYPKPVLDIINPAGQAHAVRRAPDRPGAEGRHRCWRSQVSHPLLSAAATTSFHLPSVSYHAWRRF